MDTRKKITLAQGAAANGNYPDDSGARLEGGGYQLIVESDSGSFEGVTATLKLAAGANFVVPSNGAFNAPNADYGILVGKGVRALLAISGTGSPSPAINAYLIPIPTPGGPQ